MSNCGGNFGNTGNAGVFNVNVNNTRGNLNFNIGFRSALPSKKTEDEGLRIEPREGIKEPVPAPQGEKQRRVAGVPYAAPVETNKAGGNREAKEVKIQKKLRVLPGNGLESRDARRLWEEK